jgi:16S rRNA (guanine527-N7)-methyltransferase
MTDRDPTAILGVLEAARDRGLLGTGPVLRQYEHAVDLGRAIGHRSGQVLDLGSGGGLPGLVLFDGWPDASGALLDAQRQRCGFLSRAVVELGLSSRVEVACGRAEVLARDPRFRARFDLVVARSFGPPAVTAECAVGFLSAGGELVVTEPPGSGADDGGSRWDRNGLDRLGFGTSRSIRAGKTGAVRIRLPEVADERWPRRDGMPAKRPLW